MEAWLDWLRASLDGVRAQDTAGVG
jgi:hypothetical protein